MSAHLSKLDDLLTTICLAGCAMVLLAIGIGMLVGVIAFVTWLVSVGVSA